MRVKFTLRLTFCQAGTQRCEPSSLTACNVAAVGLFASRLGTSRMKPLLEKVTAQLADTPPTMHWVALLAAGVAVRPSVEVPAVVRWNCSALLPVKVTGVADQLFGVPLGVRLTVTGLAYKLLQLLFWQARTVTASGLQVSA